MPLTVADHYEKHLGPIYTWMAGDVDAAISRSDAELDALALPSTTGGTAVDLGAGFGLHSLPLARRGFSVVAIDIIVCMGDTLTHLPNHSSVETLFRDVAASLRPGDFLPQRSATTFPCPCKEMRFILVRGDEERVLTCFLEYADTTVTVHDLLHQREGGSWRLRASSYPKLRLSPEWVVEQLSSLGLSVRRDAAPGGMIRIAARMPRSTGAFL
jgi:hypothetical protein